MLCLLVSYNNHNFWSYSIRFYLHYIRGFSSKLKPHKKEEITDKNNSQNRFEMTKHAFFRDKKCRKTKKFERTPKKFLCVESWKMVFNVYTWLWKNAFIHLKSVLCRTFYP